MVPSDQKMQLARIISCSSSGVPAAPPPPAGQTSSAVPTNPMMMPITVILELRLKPESVRAARDVMRRALQDTRAFDGNLGTDVLVDQDDEAHWLIYERWDTVEHDEAYRSFRAGEGRLTEQISHVLATRVSRDAYT